MIRTNDFGISSIFQTNVKCESEGVAWFLTSVNCSDQIHNLININMHVDLLK